MTNSYPKVKEKLHKQNINKSEKEIAVSRFRKRIMLLIRVPRKPGEERGIQSQKSKIGKCHHHPVRRAPSCVLVVDDKYSKSSPIH